MATKDALIAEEGNNFGNSGSGDVATFDKNAEVVNFELEPKAIGLTKEQLEKYRNDPFWKPVRTVLFALFWLAWLVMFGAAIAIVVLSPKCAEKQKPEWWQTKVSYQLLTATFRDSDNDGVGDFGGITEKLDELRKLGVTTVYPTPVIKTHRDGHFDPNDVVDHLAVDERFGTEQQFKQLIDTAHNRGMYVVMDLPVSTVHEEHPWYASQDESKFVTAGPTDAAFNQTNYHGFHNKNTLRYQFYQKSSNPVLNWKNEEVKSTIFAAIRKFLDLGVDGFHVDHISLLAVDSLGRPDHDAAIRVLAELTKHVATYVESNELLAAKKIVLFSSLKDVEELHAKATETGLLHYVIDNSFAQLDSKKCQPSVARCVHDALNAAHQRHETAKYTPYWQFSNTDSSRLDSRFDAPTAHLLSFLQLSLPGAVSVYYGQEYGLRDATNKMNESVQTGVMQWTPTRDDHHGFTGNAEPIFFAETDDRADTDNFETQFGIDDSPLKVYRGLAKLRQRDEALIVGETVRDELIAEDVVVFARYTPSTNNTATGSAFLVALNFGDSTRVVDLRLAPAAAKLVPTNKSIERAQIAASTANFTQYATRAYANLAESPLTLPPKQAVLIKL